MRSQVGAKTGSTSSVSSRVRLPSLPMATPASKPAGVGRKAARRA